MKTGPFRKLVVLGESTVQGGGWLASDSERYADILWRQLELAQEQPLEYVNAGIGASVISPASPGYDASAKPSAAERLDTQVIEQNPDLLVIAYGLNDMRSGMDVTTFRNEMVMLLDRIAAKIDPAIVLVNVYYVTAFHHYPPFDCGSREATLAYNEMLRTLSADRGLIYADAHAATAGCPHTVHLDTVHANKLGNMLIANRIVEAVVRACPGLADNVNRRDATTDWSKLILPWQATGREPSDTASPGR